jgi:hypothetical protein
MPRENGPSLESKIVYTGGICFLIILKGGRAMEIDKKILAKEFAAKLRAKAEVLESLNEDQIESLKAIANTGVGCSFVSPCWEDICILY